MDRLKVASGFAVKHDKLIPYLQSALDHQPVSDQYRMLLQSFRIQLRIYLKVYSTSFLRPQPEIADLQKFVYSKGTKSLDDAPDSKSEEEKRCSLKY